MRWISTVYIRFTVLIGDSMIAENHFSVGSHMPNYSSLKCCSMPVQNMLSCLLVVY